ncbi:MAG: carbamoyl-phosphate synthase large subunit [Aquificae bacterium]|nr:carbamoyl-phosphate synthase large subunit [Aquificota bacterium]
MPKRTDIHRILLIGSGPIVIGQAAEFDYSGTQGVKALKEEGYEVILVNSNPATIMTDPEIADKTYIEPLLTPVIEKIIEKERPDALLPTLGGQTALNLAVDLYEKGILDKYGVKMIGANYEAIKKAEDRELFKEAMERIGLQMPKSAVVKSLAEAEEVIDWIGFPVIIRPSFTLGGTGGSIAYNRDEFLPKVKAGLEASPVHEVLLEESVLGWKEFEMEVMRDKNDNCVIICSIENLDPMGVHTGDSITIAPAMTLTDKEYQILRDYTIAVIREIGVETGGSNVQFSQNPETGQFYVIEMNPRVSRSSALASKATGFPIAKIAAKLAVGYTLDELPNDITKETPASFEPTIDYIVTKIPRFDFAKFPEADPTLTTMMKSVGEVMAIGRTFKESFQKALRSLELGRYGFYIGLEKEDEETIRQKIITPNADRVWYIAEAFRRGYTVEDVHNLSHIDKWFLHQIKEIIDFEKELSTKTLATVTDEELEKAKQWGFSDKELARLLKTTEDKIRERRMQVSYKVVDTCAAEFRAYTPYYYSSYEKPFGKVEEDGHIIEIYDSENKEK